MKYVCVMENMRPSPNLGHRFDRGVNYFCTFISPIFLSSERNSDSTRRRIIL